jgi:hypothetical protein
LKVLQVTIPFIALTTSGIYAEIEGKIPEVVKAMNGIVTCKTFNLKII